MLMYALDVFSKSLLLITCYFLDVITKVGWDAVTKYV